MSGPVAITLFVVGVILAIMLHEWGHFATARWFGMRAERFFLGFGPTLWSFRSGETEYGVKALPLGGFVRIAGMTPTDERLAPVSEAVFAPEAVARDREAAAKATGGEVTDQPAVPPRTWQRLDQELAQRGMSRQARQDMVTRTRAVAAPDAGAEEVRRAFEAIAQATLPQDDGVRTLRHRVLRGDEDRFYGDRPAWQRAIVLVSGSGMHFVQALVLLFVAYLAFGAVEAVPRVDQVQAGTPAATSGLQPGDRIVALDGQEVGTFAEVRELLRERPGQDVALQVVRGDSELTISVTLDTIEDQETGETVGFLGVSPDIEVHGLPAGEAVRRTFVGVGSFPDLTVRTVQAFGQVFGPEGLGAIFQQVSGDADRDAAGALSPVGAAQAAAEGGERFGAFFVLLLLVSINLFVGLFNILPLPPLDGGHLAVLGVEQGVNLVRGLRGRPADFSIDPRTVSAIAVPVLVLIGTISLALVWLDITNPIQLP